MPPVLGLSRRLGRREGARAPVFLLMRHCVHPCARRMPQTMETIASDTMQGLMRYAWPGNIRELQNVIERAVILSPGPVLPVPLTTLTARVTSAPPAPARHAGSRRAHAHPGGAGGDAVGAGWPARGGSAPGDEALHPAVPPAQAGVHLRRQVKTPSPVSPALLWKCQHVGSAPVRWRRCVGTTRRIAMPRFPSLAIYQEIPACQLVP